MLCWLNLLRTHLWVTMSITFLFGGSFLGVINLFDFQIFYFWLQYMFPASVGLLQTLTQGVATRPLPPSTTRPLGNSYHIGLCHYIFCYVYYVEAYNELRFKFVNRMCFSAPAAPYLLPVCICINNLMAYTYLLLL